VPLDLSEFTEPLALAPGVLRAVLTGRPEAWLDRRHAEDVVSPRETVAHLLICEAEESWIDRLQILLDPSFEVTQGEYACTSDAELAAKKPLPQLLDEFERWRGANLMALESLHLDQKDLNRSRTEEGFGSQTVGNLLATWVAHDLYHTGQIFKSFSAPYIDRIGPYQKYLNLPHFN
jgi:uncharacterized damage-inducible protein DinB